MESTAVDRSKGSGTTTAWLAGTTVLAAFALVLAYVAIAFGGGGSDTPSAPPQTVQVTLADLTIEPSSITVPAGTEVTFAVTNEGDIDHDFRLADGTATPMLKPGESASVTSSPLTASTTAICTVPGH